MEKSTYYLIYTHLLEQKNAVSPHDLAVVFNRSRVTIQASLKRLVENGWVLKKGSSPFTTYRALNIIPKHTIITDPSMLLEPGFNVSSTIQPFIDWCRKNHVTIPIEVFIYEKEQKKHLQ